MPNHCENILSVVDSVGDIGASAHKNIRELLAGFTREVDGEPTIYFQGIVPMDEELLNESQTSSVTKVLAMPSWYEWRVENWGTKWDAYEGRWSDDGKAHIFLTAWSPPEKIAKALAAKLGVVLYLQFKEEGMGFIGEAWFNGVTGETEERNYNHGEVPPHLVDNFDLESYYDEVNAHLLSEEN